MKGERGSATVLALALVLITIATGLALLAATQLVTARARAVIAADAAALAAAPVTFPPLANGQAPAAVASELARANGARLVTCTCPIIESFESRTVEVEVTVSTQIALVGVVAVRATSRAEYVP